MESNSVWQVLFVPAAEEDFKSFDKGLQREIFKQIKKIQKDPANIGQHLFGDLVPLRKLYFDRKNYRIVFEINEKAQKIIIWGIGARAKSEIYETVKQRLALFKH